MKFLALSHCPKQNFKLCVRLSTFLKKYYTFIFFKENYFIFIFLSTLIWQKIKPKMSLVDFIIFWYFFLESLNTLHWNQSFCSTLLPTKVRTFLKIIKIVSMSNTVYLQPILLTIKLSTYFNFGKCINSSNHTDIARLKIFVGHTSTSFL